MHHFDHRGKVTETHLFIRFFTYQCEKFIRIYKIEIASHSEVPGRNGITVDKGMAIFQFIFPLGTITKMTEQ